MKKVKWILLIPFSLLALPIVNLIKKRGKGETSNLDDYSMYEVGSNKDLPRGIRNNNPGNIRINPANNWQGVIPRHLNTDGAFEQFSEMAWGVRAIAVLLRGYIRRNPSMDLRAMIHKYAPMNENDSETYLKTVAKDVGQPIDRPVKEYFDDMLAQRQLLRSIIKYENGRLIAEKDIAKGIDLV